MDIRVRGLVERHNEIKRYYQPHLDNLLENWRFYWGVHPELGLGQWPTQAIVRMQQQGRQLTQYNICMPTIDSIAGMILQMPFMPDFLPLDGEVTSLTIAATKSMFADKELMNWSRAYREILIHGLVAEGVMKMTIRDDYDQLGNIAFETCLPGSVLFAPSWKTSNRKDCQRCYKESWLSAKAILAMNPELEPLIKIEVERNVGETSGNYTGINTYNTSADTCGNLHRVIEEYYMEEKEVETEIIVTENGEELMPDIPDEDKPSYMDTYYPGWTQEQIIADIEKRKVCKMRSGCPTLLGETLVVDGEPTEVQTGGVPFHRWAASCENGEVRGAMDSLKDAQVNVNYTNAMIIHKLQHEGGGGSQFIDYSKFASDTEAKKYATYRNRPDMVFKVKPGTLSRDGLPAIPTQSTGVPTELYKHIEFLINQVLPNISKRPPSSLGRPEPGNQTSGVLYSQMKMQADNMIYTMVAGLRDFWNDVYEAWLMQAATTYANENVPRSFQHQGESVVLNERVQLPDGSIGIRNDMSQLKRMRHKIVISDRPDSPTEHIANMAILLDHLRNVPPENLASRALINREMARNIDQISEDTKEKLEEVGDVELDVALTQLKLNKVKMMAEMTQIEAQMSSMMAMQGGQPGTPGGALMPPSAGALPPPDANPAGVPGMNITQPEGAIA